MAHARFAYSYIRVWLINVGVHDVSQYANIR